MFSTTPAKYYLIINETDENEEVPGYFSSLQEVRKYIEENADEMTFNGSIIVEATKVCDIKTGVQFITPSGKEL